MGVFKERGIIIKQNDYGEGHRMLSIFTASRGIIKAVSYGAKRQKSKSAAASQFLCCGEFELYASNRDAASINSINAAESFSPVSEDIEKLALCTYFADITYAMLGEGNPDERLLKTFLNVVYALAYRDEPLDKVKAVYELRLMTLEGYMPNIGACGCGSRDICAFDFDKGSTVCAKCRGKNSAVLSPGVYKAMAYITRAEDKRILSFTGSAALFKELGAASERYLLTHTERSFKSLDYYKLMRQMKP